MLCLICKESKYFPKATNENTEINVEKALLLM